MSLKHFYALCVVIVGLGCGIVLCAQIQRVRTAQLKECRLRFQAAHTIQDSLAVLNWNHGNNICNQAL